MEHLQVMERAGTVFGTVRRLQLPTAAVPLASSPRSARCFTLKQSSFLTAQGRNSFIEQRNTRVSFLLSCIYSSSCHHL